MTAHARNTDPATSHYAAESVTNITEVKRRILQTFEKYGAMTDEQLIENYNKLWGNSFKASVSGLRSRRCDLVREGYLEDKPRLKGSTISGRKATVFGLAGVLF